jgi:hypothetical protein
LPSLMSTLSSVAPSRSSLSSLPVCYVLEYFGTYFGYLPRRKFCKAFLGGSNFARHF